MATVGTIAKDAGIYLRDTLREDSALCTLLGITTSNSKNYIFFLRPSDQVKGFDNPRIVIEMKPSRVANMGDNPDSLRTGEFNYQISIWLDEKPSTKIIEVLDKINDIIHNLEMGVDNNFGLFKISNFESYPDPDKEHTVFGMSSVNFDLGGGI